MFLFGLFFPVEYAGLRREEILALQWDCVILDTDVPYLKVRRAWHTESDRPVIMTELKTPAARRDIAINQSPGQRRGSDEKKEVVNG